MSKLSVNKKKLKLEQFDTDDNTQNINQKDKHKFNFIESQSFELYLCLI